MKLLDLAVVYALLGLACAVAVGRAELAMARPAGERARREAWARAAWQGAIAVALWPIWAPLTLTRPSARPSEVAQGAPPPPSADARVVKASTALTEAAAACAGTPFEALLSRDAALRITGELARAAGRHAELEALLANPRYDAAAAEARVATLEREGSTTRALATARLHLDNVRRLVSLRDRDARALEELAELAQALHAQLALARFAGSSAGQAGDIVAEVWSRIEGFDAVNESFDVATPAAGGAA